MEASSIAEFRKAYGSDIPIKLPSGLTLVCRKPDLQDLVFRQVVPLPLLKSVFQEAAAAIAQGDTPASIEAFLANGNGDTARLIDIWTCCAARAPRVFLTEAEAGDQALWVGEIPLSARLAIFAETFSLGEVGRLAAAGATVSDPSVDAARVTPSRRSPNTRRPNRLRTS
jgi:hypothetical protein